MYTYYEVTVFFKKTNGETFKCKVTNIPARDRDHARELATEYYRTRVHGAKIIGFAPEPCDYTTDDYFE